LNSHALHYGYFFATGFVTSWYGGGSIPAKMLNLCVRRSFAIFA